MNSNYSQLINKLDEFIRKYYKNQLIKGIIYTFTFLLAAFLTLTTLEYFAHFSTTARTFLFYAFIAGASFTLGKLIVIPLLKLYRIGAIISQEQAAAIIGTHFKNVEDKLLNILQLKNTHSSTTGNTSLIEAAINQKIEVLKPIPFTSAINLKANRRYVKYAAVPLLVLILLLFYAPAILSDGTKRIVEHQTYFVKQAPFQFSITNKELLAMQQEDYTVTVAIEGKEIPQSAYIDIEGNEYLLNKTGESTYEYTFKNVQHAATFKLQADGFSSEEYSLKVVKKPTLTNFTIQLNYPAYIGKPNELIQNTGDITVPEGTKAEWLIQANNTNDIVVKRHGVDKDSIVHCNVLNEKSFSYKTYLTKGFTYSLLPTNNDVKKADEVNYSVNVIADQQPTINVEEQKDTASRKRLYFAGEIKDDYGFTSLTFNYKLNNAPDNNAVAADGKTLSSSYKTVHLNVNNKLVQQSYTYYWDLSALAVNAGDEIEYFFEVYDNDAVNGRKSARTNKMVFKAPTVAEQEKTSEKNNQEIKKDLEKSIAKAKQLQKELGQMKRKMVDKKSLSWEDKKQVEKLLEQQKELQKQVEEVKQENQQNINQQNEFNTPDEKLIEKQQELEKLFEQIMTDELKKMYEEMNKMMQQLDKEKVQEMMDKMKMDNKDLEKDLDRTLELFKQIEFEQKLDKLKNELNSLANEQKQLADKTEKAAEKKTNEEEQKKLEEQQKELNKKFEEAQKNMDELQKKNEELEKPAPLDKMDKQQEDIAKDMQKSSDQLGEKKNKKASQSQKDAAQKMEQMAKEMQAMQDQMAEEANEEDIKTLRQILENLLQLSFDQEQLLKNFKSVDNNNPQYVQYTKQQKKLVDDAKAIEDSLFALSKRNPKVSGIVNKEIADINDNMSRSIEYLADRNTPQATVRQQYAMTAINNLALLLSESLQQMQQEAQAQSKSKSQGSGSCKKPGGKGEPKPSSMAGMKKMQQQLNKQMQQMKEGMQKGGAMPGAGMSEQLARMAAQQEAIRQQMQKMAQQIESGQGEGGKESGGANGNAQKLREMVKKMEETENDIVNKRITQETLKRQQDILTRLLEAEKAEREREQDEKRKSNEAKTQEFSAPAQFTQYNALKQRETELLRTVPPNFSPFYKQKVSTYFNTIIQK